MGGACSEPRATHRSLAVNQGNFQISEDEEIVFTKKSENSQGVVYLLYGDYLTGDHERWEVPIKYVEAGLHVVCVLRPTITDLPESFVSLTEEYRVAVAKQRAAGVICVGHIDTHLMAKTMWNYTEEVEAYATWMEFAPSCGLDGIYLDNCAYEDEDYAIKYYTKACAIAREFIGPQILTNFPKPPLTIEYRKISDIIVTFQDDISKFICTKPEPTPDQQLLHLYDKLTPFCVHISGAACHRELNPEYPAYCAAVKKAQTEKLPSKEQTKKIEPVDEYLYCSVRPDIVEERVVKVLELAIARGFGWVCICPDGPAVNKQTVSEAVTNVLLKMATHNLIKPDKVTSVSKEALKPEL